VHTITFNLMPNPAMDHWPV